MKKKIFITGGSGFIGKEVVKLLASKNRYRITVLSRKQSKSDYNDVRFIAGDILDKTSFQKYAEQADIILHIAGLVTGNKKIIKKVNLDGTKNIIEVSNGKKLIFISSENVLYSNQDSYGESKKQGEKIVKNLRDYLILRPSVVYGKNDKKNLGKVINICKKWPIIFTPGNGKSLMQPIFVTDIAHFILNAIEKNIKGTFILAGPSKISLNEFIDQITKIINKKIIKIHIPLFIMYPFIKLNEYLLKNPVIRWSQLKNLNTNRTYDINQTTKELNYFPIPIGEGLLRILK